jgi:hypothetical protein
MTDLSRRRLLTFAGAAFGAAALPAPFARAEQYSALPAFDPLYPRPPYLQLGVDEYFVAVFEADRDALVALLPKGLTPAASNSFGVSHYIVRKGVGLAPFEANYFFVEVDGFDAPDGGKARVPVYGLYSPDRVVTAMREVMGYPMRLGNTKIEAAGKRMKGTALRDGKELWSTEIQLKGDPIPLSGQLHYLGLRNAPDALGVRPAIHELSLSRLSWSGDLTMADPQSLKLSFPDKHPMGRLTPKKMLYGYSGRNVNWVFGHNEVVAKLD